MLETIVTLPRGAPGPAPTSTRGTGTVADPAVGTDHPTGAPAVRLRDYDVAQRPELLSFVTTVWNTDPAYVNALAQSVFTQDGGTEFEWFILDNGTTRQDTLAAMEEIVGHPCVRFSRVEDNLGIIGGMRYCLEHASGRYILPLDSDDLLAPDCVRILTTQIVENDFPALLYSDEDKLVDDTHITAYRKPDWDPVLFLHSCYIAHLCAIDRTRALELGVYTDPRAEGSHDWDTFTRFHLAGHAPVHVAELLYSWRMHAMSTSSNIGAKPVVYDSQMAVIERFLSGAPDPKRYSVIKSPLFAGSPDWWIRRNHSDAVPLTTVLLTGAGPTATQMPDVASPDMSGPDVPSNDYPNHRVIPVPLSGGLAALAAATQGLQGLVHLLWDQVKIQQPEWAWEAQTMLELFPDAVAVGGRICGPNGRILEAGQFFGFGRGCDLPARGQPLNRPGYFATNWKQHSASAVSSQHAVFRAGFLADVLPRLIAHADVSLPYLGAWIGTEARLRGQRIIYSPFLQGEASADWDALVPDRERAVFILTHTALLPETQLLSPHLSLDSSTPYAWATAEKRAAHRRRLMSWAEAQDQ